MSTSADGIVALVAHARDVPATERQRFAHDARARSGSRGLLLETCHRVEWYATSVGDEGSADAPSILPLGGQMLTGEAAVHHAVAVAVGLDSVVVGEDQVLHQLRRALDTARADHTLEPTLERLFAMALRAGRLARSWHRGPMRSLADVAIATIEGQMGVLAGHEVLIVGAGRMGRLAARACVTAGASVAVASRSADRATDLASSIGGTVTAFDPGPDVGRFAGIIIALSGPWPIGPETLRAIAARSSLVVDLSVPLAVPDPLVVTLGARLTTADDLARHPARGDSRRDRTAVRLDQLIERTTADFLSWLDAADRRAAAQALLERADREREAELAELWRRLPDLDPQARATIEGMSRHLAKRLLRDPLARLGADADGRHERAIRELWAL